MSSQNTMLLMSLVEFALWAVLGFLFWRKKLHRRFPSMGAYLALRVASMPPLVFLYYGRSQHWFHGLCAPVYFYLYFAEYIVSAVLLYFICVEVFRSALSAFPGLMKFGIVIFRWAVLASVIVSFSTITFSHRSVLLIPTVAYGLMRSVSIVELCLLGFLFLGMNALRLSGRDMAFGIALGLGLMSANDFVISLIIPTYTSLTAPWQFVYQSAILVTLGMWVVYCSLPEPARLPLVVSANSTILRWNEIASALGHTGTQVAVQPAGGFLLTDVERVVGRVHLKNRESET